MIIYQKQFYSEHVSSIFLNNTEIPDRYLSLGFVSGVFDILYAHDGKSVKSVDRLLPSE